MSNVSVLIITYNEEVNIVRCLDSVRWSDDVVILDSFSRDRTIELVSAYHNVRIFQRAFDDFSSQRNYGLHEICYRNRWLLILDADEVVEPLLGEELIEVARQGLCVTYNVFLLRRKVFFKGHKLRWNISYDFWIARLVRPAMVRYEGIIHEKVCFDGHCGRLTAALEHHQFAKGIDDWLARRSRYARLEAKTGLATESSRRWPWGFLNRNPLIRTASLKYCFYRLPLRWLIYCIYNLLFKFPYLDGMAGLRYVLLETYSQYLAVKIMKETKNA